VATGKVSEETYKELLAVATAEPSFTGPYLSWLTGKSVSLVALAVKRMNEERRLDLVEPKQGTFAAVYVVRPVRHVSAVSPARLALPELDAGVGAEAPQRGVVVPHTRPRGSSGKPTTDRKRQERGVRVKRARQGT
jgi:hypothetical protein